MEIVIDRKRKLKNAVRSRIADDINGKYQTHLLGHMGISLFPIKLAKRFIVSSAWKTIAAGFGIDAIEETLKRLRKPGKRTK